MKIPATEIQALEFEAQGQPVNPTLSYNKGWFWETEDTIWPATDAQAADALLERVLVLQSEQMDLRHRAQLGDALQQALQTQELFDASSHLKAGDVSDFGIEAPTVELSLR